MPDLLMPLSESFVLKELVESSTAARDLSLTEAQQNPPPEVIDNLKYFVTNTLQPIRSRFDFPITINSGYRSPALNRVIGGADSSQHTLGEAADCKISSTFLTDPKVAYLREGIDAKVREITGKPIRANASENFYLFAYVCIFLDELDVDQVIHEYGLDFGHPSWVHISSSRRRNSRQILAIGKYTNKKYLKPTLEEALSYGT